MSRGPGVWQRRILAALAEREAFFLVDLLPTDFTPAQYNAMNRAAMRLAANGKIESWRFLYCDAAQPHTAVCRVGHGKPERDLMREIHKTVGTTGVSVGQGAKLRSIHHLPGETGLSVGEAGMVPPVHHLERELERIA